MLAGALAAAIAVAFVGEWAAPGTTKVAGAAPVLAGVLLAMWAIALLFADMPKTAAALLATGITASHYFPPADEAGSDGDYGCGS